MFQPCNGMRYVPFLKALHRAHVFDWYMEVGCRTGRTLADVRGKTIAVDPFFKVTADIIQDKPALHIFQQKSDAFFKTAFLEKMTTGISFSFLDGMHLFEFLLRDIINTERNSKPDGVIALHDCIPYDHEMTSRIVGPEDTGAWTGDVWKLIPILQRYRPDLNIDVLDCRPTGLVLLSGLSPGDATLSEYYDQILAEWTNVTLEEFGTERFFGLFEYKSGKAEAKAGFPAFAHLSLEAEAQQKPEFVSP
ncbi:hypothetical protein [Ruegeria sp.]|uniref:hypothetical protein n=1 Tax=Ruegeria sp. TaxID=1879320 RepID=UPI003B5C1048